MQYNLGEIIYIGIGLVSKAVAAKAMQVRFRICVNFLLPSLRKQRKYAEILFSLERELRKYA